LEAGLEKNDVEKTFKNQKVQILGFSFGEISYRSYLILYFNCDLYEFCYNL